MKYINLSLLITIPLLFQACIANKKPLTNDIVATASTKCPGPEMSISIIPSRGLLADAMAISAIKVGNDGGFAEEFSTFIRHDPKNVTLYCSNPHKLEALISHTFSLYQNNALKGVSVCLIGLDYTQALQDEATRTGAVLTFIPY